MGIAFGVYICCDASSSYAMDDELGGYEEATVDVYAAFGATIPRLTFIPGMCEGTSPGHVQGAGSDGIQFSVTFCGINSSSGISGGAGA